MKVDLSPETEAKLARLAGESGRDAETLARDAIERLVDYDAWFVAEVEKGLAQIDRGQVLKHEAVGARLDQHLRDKQPRI